MRRPDAPEWQVAVQSELDSLIQNETWSLVPVSQAAGKRVLKNRLLFTRKYNPDGSLQKYKARLVVLGNTQQQGVDFDKVFSPVVSPVTVRTIMAIAAARDYELHQMDAVTAFLNSSLDEEVYMEVPDGLKQPGEPMVCRLRKSLYGLKQAPRCWMTTLTTWLTAYGFRQSVADPCLYSKQGLWVGVWVDDFLVMASDSEDLSKFKSDIATQFRMRDLGEVRHFLGLEVERNRAERTITITQTAKIRELLEQYGMTECNPVSTPLSPGTVLLPATETDEVVRSPAYPYRELVGSLLYMAMWTRPDIASAVNMLSRHMARPTTQHWLAAKHVLRYLRATPTLGLTYSGSTTPGTVTTDNLRGYVDANWGPDTHPQRKSTTGYAFTLHNAAVVWASKTQQTIAQSTTEAEYMALSSASKTAIHLRSLLSSFHPSGQSSNPLPPVPIMEDNQGAIKIALKDTTNPASKHIAIQHHAIRESVCRGDITLQHISTHDQLADCLTKSLPAPAVQRTRDGLLGHAVQRQLS